MATRERKADAWAHEAKDFLRKLLIGKNVDVQMEYNRKIPPQGQSFMPPLSSPTLPTLPF